SKIHWCHFLVLMSNYLFRRLPSEILIKILSYLDASTLFSISHINKLFHQLANDNSLWKRIYIVKFGKDKQWKLKCTDELLLKMEDRAAGSWKWLYFKSVAARDMDMWKRHLRHTSRYTGLPCQTEKVLRCNKRLGHQNTLELSWSHFFETSVTLCWSAGGYLPSYQQISTLELHGVRRIALNCPGLKKYRQPACPPTPSLCVSVSSFLRKTNSFPCFAPSDLRSVAFIMFTLHFHKLVERSTQGSSVCPFVEPMDKPPFDDIDPEYGLHGYQLHIVLHSTVCKLMSERFSQLFCHRGNISDGLIQLTAINSTNLSQHTPLSGNVTLPWRCEALQGEVENCCIMSLTLLDEFSKPFTCVSSPVSMKLEKMPISYDHDSEHYLIHYQDSDAQVKMRLVWMKEQQQFVLVSLVIYLSVCNVNRHFGRDY
uniref:F-box domain-containing protein n=1 Tax=Amphiprion percula TaxID=161767 RepID=A0A3P8TZN7_AMPPE